MWSSPIFKSPPTTFLFQEKKKMLLMALRRCYREACLHSWVVGRLRDFGDCFLENVGLEKLTRLNEMLCEVWLHIWIDYTFFLSNKCGLPFRVTRCYGFCRHYHFLPTKLYHKFLVCIRSTNVIWVKMILSVKYHSNAYQMVTWSN